MGIEIERKFLPRGDGWRAAAHKVVPMAQGYLNDLALVDSGAMRASVRVRIEGDAAFLNIKSRELGTTRQEFEYPVPVAEARALLELCVGGLVEKNRHYVEHAGHLWEVDEFLGDNAGLVVAEIELASEDETFAQPDWVGVEATHAARYYNLALASRPFSQWREDERQAHDLMEGR
ncbi:CYTH domain-containing protein [Thermomonas sp.]|jgi:adenylate cyclase|uniref:CYTH domain-containing protein n=1 Tax=Thermomonas sp. TaxID=1971895 RepID=UPI00257FD878|nr:CYTH domain-containing protein [Thermomonas sp.]